MAPSFTVGSAMADEAAVAAESAAAAEQEAARLLEEE